MIIGVYNYMHKYDFSNVRGIIHVGAHDGREYEEYQTTFFEDIPIHWFEPQKKIFSMLLDRIGDKKTNHFYNFGLGSKEETKQIWTEEENRGESASFSQPKHHVDLFPHVKFYPSDFLEVKTLDSFQIEGPNVLVLDVQGFELEVLRGSVETLKKIDHIFCEINGVEMYEGCPTLSDLCEFLIQHGFILREDWWTEGQWGDGYWSK